MGHQSPVMELQKITKGMLPKDKSTKHKFKNCLNLEWSLVYIEQDGVLLLIFAKS